MTQTIVAPIAAQELARWIQSGTAILIASLISYEIAKCFWNACGAIARKIITKN